MPRWRPLRATARPRREADPVGDLGDRADLRVAVVVLGDEEHTVLVADVDGQGDVHVREDDEVLQGTSSRRMAFSFSLTVLAFVRMP